MCQCFTNCKKQNYTDICYLDNLKYCDYLKVAVEQTKSNEGSCKIIT